MALCSVLVTFSNFPNKKKNHSRSYIFRVNGFCPPKPAPSCSAFSIARSLPEKKQNITGTYFHSRIIIASLS
jgi:hypothetical protein